LAEALAADAMRIQPLLRTGIEYGLLL